MPAPTLTARCSPGSYFSREVVPFPLSIFLSFLSLGHWACAPATVFTLLGGSFDVSHVPSFASLLRGRWGGEEVARHSSRGMPQHEKEKKCCYQLRGSKKHVHSREASAGHYIRVSVHRL